MDELARFELIVVKYMVRRLIRILLLGLHTRRRWRIPINDRFRYCSSRSSP